MLGTVQKFPTTPCERLAAAAGATPGMVLVNRSIDAGSENPRVGGSNPPVAALYLARSAVAMP